MRPRASVVVPTCRRPGMLARCIAALLAQDLEPSQFEVIVVDDEPAEATRRVVEYAARVLAAERAPMPAAGERAAPRPEQGEPAVRYVENRGARGPAAARNLGWRAARGEVIAFTDDDCIPSAGWLRAGLAVLDAGADGASGRIVVPRPSPPTDHEANVALLERSRFATASCFYRRDALAAIGGFDERFRLAWREDSDAWLTMVERGFRLVDAPEAVVTHPVRSAPWGVSLREQRKSRYNALLYRKHPRLYRECIGPMPNRRYLGIVGALIAAPAAFALGAPRAGAVLAAAWAAQTAAFAAHRLRRTSHRPGHVAEMVVTSALIPPLSLYWRLRGAVEFRVPFV